MAGADDGYFPRPEKRNPVFGRGRPGDPYFEPDAEAGGETGFNLEDDGRLPWLEGDDDDVGERRGGPGAGMLLGALGLVALAVIAGGVVWAINSRPSQPLVADGGVIAAPAEPYKMRPANPGGDVVAGTGDTSFAVAEGQSRPVQIDKRGEVEAHARPAPGQSATQTAAAPTPAAPVAGGVGVQVGAYASREAAEAGWVTLKGQYEPLAAMNHRVVSGKADIGTVYRLQAVPGDGAAARALCSGMKAAGMSCQVKN